MCVNCQPAVGCAQMAPHYLLPGLVCSPIASPESWAEEVRELASCPVFPGGPGESVDRSAAFGEKEGDGLSALGRGTTTQGLWSG